jgi:DNA polymerase III delta prime subunit
MFDVGMKFVILDEVDYMTKNAQHALKYLLQTCSHNVRFCLICNYISKIEESLQNEFICVRFNQLPRQDIYRFIRNITENEN